MYSVLMSVYQKEKPEYLRESVKSVLAQTMPTDDFVIVCDGPLTPQLDAVLEEFQEANAQVISLIRLPQNVGLGRALNEGMKHCKHDIIARMDSDDVSFSERMEKQYQVLTTGHYDIVSSTLLEFETDLREIKATRKLPEKMPEILRFARRRNPFNHPAVMYLKTSVESAGGYQDFYLFEDYYLWVRMLMAGMQGYNIPEPLLYMRSGSDMIRRRGGIPYAKAIWNFRCYQFRAGFSSFSDFAVTAFGHVMVALLPNGLRKLFYKAVLRK